MKVLSEKVDMNVFVPLDSESFVSKTDEEDGEEKWFVRGFASTPGLDLQGEIVQPSGIDIDYFLKAGWLNYEHKQDAEFVVGAPTKNSYIDMENGLFLEAILFKDNPYAQSMWELATNINKAGLDRDLGFSIEGFVNKRNDRDKNIIEDIVVRNVAITKNPANPEATWESFVSKAWETGTETNPAEMEDAAALRREHLAQAITIITSNLREIKEPEERDKLWGDVAQYLDYADKDNQDNGVILLQLAKGVSAKEAKDYLDSTKIE